MVVRSLFFVSAVILLSVSHCYEYAGSCQQTMTLNTFCSTVIFYPFYVPPNQTVKDLDNIVDEYFAQNTLQLISSACISSLLTLFCASVFIQCPTPWEVFTKNQTQMLNVSIPFGRPSKHMCRFVNMNCQGMCNSDVFNFGFTTIDHPTLDQPNPRSLELSTDDATAYFAMASRDFSSTPTPVEFSLPNPFICSDLFSEDVSVFSNAPYGSLMFEEVGRQQPRYVTQLLISEKIQNVLSSLPVWLSQSCRLSMREYLCKSSIFEAQPTTLYSALVVASAPLKNITNALTDTGLQTVQFLNNTVYVPKFPSRTICYAYYSECGEFVGVWLTGILRQHLGMDIVNYLVVDCNSVVPAALGFPEHDRYPVANKISPNIVSLAYHEPDGTKVFFDTPLFSDTTPLATTYAADLEPVIPTVCPPGFVIPEDPNDPNILWMPGTGCAVACK